MSKIFPYLNGHSSNSNPILSDNSKKKITDTIKELKTDKASALIHSLVKDYQLSDITTGNISTEINKHKSVIFYINKLMNGAAQDFSVVDNETIFNFNDGVPIYIEKPQTSNELKVRVCEKYTCFSQVHLEYIVDKVIENATDEGTWERFESYF